MKLDINKGSSASHMEVYRKFLILRNLGQKPKFGPKMDSQVYMSWTACPIFLNFWMKLDINKGSPLRHMKV